MGRFPLRALGYAALGLFLVPVLVACAVLIPGFATSPSCRAGTDSGGCAMGAAGAAISSAIPGAVLGVFVAAWRSFRRG